MHMNVCENVKNYPSHPEEEEGRWCTGVAVIRN